MRLSTLAPALIFGTLASGALAMPVPEIPAPNDIHRVQLVCTPQSCIDQRTGVYTASNCDYRGCRPSSGPVGRLPGYGGGPAYGGGPGYGRGYGYGPPPGPPPPRYYGPRRYDPRW